METLPPTSYLHVYLMSHGKWTAFLPLMRVGIVICFISSKASLICVFFFFNVQNAANIQQNTGLGFIVPDESKGTGSHVTSMQHLAALFAAKEEPDIDGMFYVPFSAFQYEGFLFCAIGIEHGSRYAKSLGFEGDTKWPTDTMTDTPTKKKKKSKKKVVIILVVARIGGAELLCFPHNI